MATEQPRDEAEIRQLIGTLVESIRTADLESLKAFYASDVVSFDVGPRLHDIGSRAKMSNWEEAFSFLQPPLGYEIRDLSITAGDDVAFAHGINRLSGTLNGEPFGSWVRWSAGFQKVDGNWLIAHDHVSMPIDFVSRSALVNLEPDRLPM